MPAASFIVCPSASSCSTSRCLGVGVRFVFARPLLHGSSRSASCSDGATYFSPRSTAFIAFCNSPLAEVFNKYPDAHFSSAAAATSAFPSIVSTMIFSFGSICFNCSPASSPFSSGMKAGTTQNRQLSKLAAPALSWELSKLTVLAAFRGTVTLDRALGLAQATFPPSNLTVAPNPLRLQTIFLSRYSQLFLQGLNQR